MTQHISQSTPVLVITGPVGVGKTSVAVAMADALDDRDIAHALVDMDWLRYAAPRPADDRFHERLGMQNLAAVWANYHAAGAQRLILVDVVETAATVAGYQRAIPNATIQVVQLDAPLATIWRRLEQRETGTSLQWHQARAAELREHWQRNPIEARVLDTSQHSAAKLAQMILQHYGWID